MERKILPGLRIPIGSIGGQNHRTDVYAMARTGKEPDVVDSAGTNWTLEEKTEVFRGKLLEYGAEGGTRTTLCFTAFFT